MVAAAGGYEAKAWLIDMPLQVLGTLQPSRQAATHKLPNSPCYEPQLHTGLLLVLLQEIPRAGAAELQPAGAENQCCSCLEAQGQHIEQQSSLDICCCKSVRHKGKLPTSTYLQAGWSLVHYLVHRNGNDGYESLSVAQQAESVASGFLRSS